MKPHFASRPWLAALACFAMTGATAIAAEPPADPTDPAGVEFFEKKVRPILVARCHECHGPNKTKGDLRLDSRAGALEGGDAGPVVVPGKPQESLLVDAIRYGDTYQMPPKSQLPADQIATLVEWVRLGVPWGPETPKPSDGNGKPPGEFDLAARASHWSFQPLSRVTPPDVSDPSWIKTPVDRFILAKLATAGLAPAPPADKRALLRRATYDLIGLPPTAAEIEAFLADDSPTAYEHVVDRLLASPRYGERWARHWLDLVRYAETYGHEFDFDMPNAYRYRDYIIRAFNDDLPYDQFVVEQVAGDLLSNPRRHPRDGTNESIIATGCFLFGEAKHSPVDSRQDEADRIDNQIDVLAKAFLGLTVSCARCHDHKFDPISTKDYYALAGYLQSSRYQQAFIDAPDKLAGTIRALAEVRSERQAACVEFVRSAIAPELGRLAATLLGEGGPRSAGNTEAWSKYLGETARLHVDDPLYAWAELMHPRPERSPADFAARRRALSEQLGAQLSGDSSAATAAPVVFADFRGPDYGDWQPTGAAFGTTPAGPIDWTFAPSSGRARGRLLGTSAAHSGLVSTRLQGVLRSPTFEISKSKIFYRLHGSGGHVRLILNGLQLIKDPIYGGLKFEAPGAEPRWHEQDVSKWIGQRAYIEVVDDGDGYIALEQVVFADDRPPAPKPNRLASAMQSDPSLTTPALLAERYQALFQKVLGAVLAGSNEAGEEAADRAAIFNGLVERPWFDQENIKSQLAALESRMSALNQRQQQLESQVAPPRQALALADGTAENEHVFIRGSHKTLGEEVPRRFLEVLGGTRYAPPQQGSGRLELARQMVSADNPLLPRAIVNRLWHHHFGAGLVRSVDDFGAMGQPPTHPELLDWLAAELMRGRWSLKQLHRLMVLSNTYRMSSQTRPDADRADPTNRLWHRMTVRRLEAECIRDAMLAVSGRLDPTMFDPSVMPHLTEYMTGRGKPAASGPLDGEGRRSIYLAVRRNFLSPLFQAFDYPTPFTTIGRRGTSNVPAQALAMMNNPLVLEQARLWAQRELVAPDRSPAQRIGQMYLTALARPPDDAELQAALAFVEIRRESPAEQGADAQVWTDFAHVLLNLKEFIFVP